MLLGRSLYELQHTWHLTDRQLQFVKGGTHMRIELVTERLTLVPLGP